MEDTTILESGETCGADAPAPNAALVFVIRPERQRGVLWAQNQGCGQISEERNLQFAKCNPGVVVRDDRWTRRKLDFQLQKKKKKTNYYQAGHDSLVLGPC